MYELALVLIMLHEPQGHAIELNPRHIISMRSARTVPNRLLAASVRCLIRTVDGKFIAVMESCATVRRLIAEAGAPKQ